MKTRRLLIALLVIGVCAGVAAPALADAGGGGGNPGFCACVACGATCQFVWGQPMCYGTGNPYDACYFCMFGCSTGGNSCCVGPPTW